MEPGQRAALEAILGDPLAPWLDDCRRAGPADAGADGGLVEIRLRRRCESWAARSGARPWPTWIRLDVCGIGAVWPGFRPGEPHHREGVEARREYAIECTPLATLGPLPLRFDPVMMIMVEGPTAPFPETGASLPAPETTLLDLLAALFDEFSMYGSVRKRGTANSPSWCARTIRRARPKGSRCASCWRSVSRGCCASYERTTACPDPLPVPC